MTATRLLRTPTEEQPFSITAEKYNTEYRNGKVPGSNFPYYEVQRLPGYSERSTPGLSAVDITKELAIHLAAFAQSEDCPLQYQERDVSKYLWMQASRGMLAWHEIFNVVRGAKKRNRRQRIAHYFGYDKIVGPKGVSRYRKRLKLIRYITQEGMCTGCQIEGRFSDLTLDRIRPGKRDGAYELSNVQLMCKPCNNSKGASCSG